MFCSYQRTFLDVQQLAASAWSGPSFLLSSFLITTHPSRSELPRTEAFHDLALPTAVFNGAVSPSLPALLDTSSHKAYLSFTLIRFSGSELCDFVWDTF